MKKPILTAYLILVCCISLSGATAIRGDEPIEKKMESFFELSDTKGRVGSEGFNRVVLARFQALGSRDDIVHYVLKRADETETGVRISYFKSLVLSWADSDLERQLVEFEVQVSFDAQKRPIGIASVMKKTPPLPEPQLVPAEESQLDLPPPKKK